MTLDDYLTMGDEELRERVCRVKKMLGKRLIILAHHYQRDEVYEFGDITGDSFKLAQEASKRRDVEYIVFCGVHFMAEAARILASPMQRVFLPDMLAGCPMSDMAHIDAVERVWKEIGLLLPSSKIIPVAYMNTSAEIKAFCGRNGGSICTSSNAANIFRWALANGDKIFFLPDRHLGENTARTIGLGEGFVVVGRDGIGGIKPNLLQNAPLILWDGYCHVHTHFLPSHVEKARKEHPACRIIVHPECTPDVARLADKTGSTEQIKRYVEEAPAGSTIVIGTEINMVTRLARRHADKNIFPLANSLCPNMFKISLHDLAFTLENLPPKNEIFVDEGVATDARLALERMLENA